jgi:hypothetical protein
MNSSEVKSAEKPIPAPTGEQTHTGPFPCGSCKLHSIRVGLRLLNNENLARRVFDQAEMIFQK